MKRSHLFLVCAGAVSVVAVATSCSTIIGADFDVMRAGAGGSASSSSSTSGSGGSSSTTTTGGGGGDATCQPAQCKPELVADQENLPLGLAVSGAWVYWSSRGTGAPDGTIKRTHVTGPPMNQATIAAGLINPSQVAVDADHVYWTSNAAMGAVYCSSLAGGGDMHVVATQQTLPVGIVVAGGMVYWTAWGATGLVRKSPAGCAFSPPAPSDVATDLVSPSLLAATEKTLFVTEFTSSGRVMSIDLKTEQKMPRMSGLDTPNGIVVRDGDVCFTTSVHDGSVFCPDISSGYKEVALHQDTPATIAVDSIDGTLYWANQGDGTIMKYVAGAALPDKVASGQHSPTGIVVAGNYVYWTNYTSVAAGGSVMRQRIH